MPNPILQDRDRRVKVMVDGVPVSASVIQSQYSRFLNFDSASFDVQPNDTLGTFDIAGLSTDEKVTAYINGTQIGSVSRKINFSTDFTGSDDAGNGRFDIASPPRILLPDGTTTTRSRVGTFYGGSGGGNGLLSGIFISGATVTSELAAADMYTVFTSDTSDADLGGFSTPNFITRRAYNPTLKIRFKGNNSTEKMFLGLLSDVAHPINETDPIDSLSGVAFGYDDADTKFVVWSNDGSGASVKTLTADNKNTTVHTVTITLTAASATVNYDGTNVLNAATTNIPASATNLCLHCNMESVGGTATPLAVSYAYLVQDV